MKHILAWYFLLGLAVRWNLANGERVPDIALGRNNIINHNQAIGHHHIRSNPIISNSLAIVNVDNVMGSDVAGCGISPPCANLTYVASFAPLPSTIILNSSQIHILTRSAIFSLVGGSLLNIKGSTRRSPAPVQCQGNAVSLYFKATTGSNTQLVMENIDIRYCAGVWVEARHLIVTGSSFASNLDYGFNLSNVNATFLNTNFDSNKNVAIFGTYSTLVVDTCNFRNNIVGGAIYCGICDVTVTTSNFIGNMVNVNDDATGALSVQYGELQVFHSMFWGNVLQSSNGPLQGGDIFGSSLNIFRLDSCVFRETLTSTTAGDMAGGSVYAYEVAEAILTNCNFSDIRMEFLSVPSTAHIKGGAINLFALNTTISFCNFSNITIIGPSVVGGGAYLMATSMSLFGMTFSNIAVSCVFPTALSQSMDCYGGAMYALLQGDVAALQVTETKFSKNTLFSNEAATLCGGAGSDIKITSNSSRVLIKNSLWEFNDLKCRGTVGAAGGLRVISNSNATVRVENSSFHDNYVESSQGEGGGMWLVAGGVDLCSCSGVKEPQSNLEIFDSQFWKNVVVTSGAALVATGFNTRVNSSLFLENAANSSSAQTTGGAIDIRGTDCFQSNDVLIVNTTARGNVASMGSFIYITCDGDFFLLSSNIFLESGQGILRLSGGGFLNDSTLVTCVPGSIFTFSETPIVVTNAVSMQSLQYTNQTKVDISCQLCKVGTYSVVPSSSKSSVSCLSCPNIGAVCDGGANIKARHRYWGYALDDGSVSMHLCPDGYCCASSTDSCPYQSCENNREGVLCGSCGQNRTSTMYSTSCQDMNCNKPWFFPVLIICTLAGTLAIGRLLAWETEIETNVQQKSYIPMVKNVLYYNQMVSAITQYGKYSETPSAVSNFVAYYRQLILGVQAPSNNANGYFICLGMQLDQVQTVALLILPQSFLLLWILLIFVAMVVFRRIKSDHWDATTLHAINIRAVNALLNGISIVYSQFATVALELVGCVKVGDRSVLFVDGTVECYQKWQIVLLVFGMLILIAVPISFTCISVMERFKPKKGDESLRNAVNTSFFLSVCVPYRIETRFGDSVFLFGRMFVAIFAVVLQTFPGIREVMLLLVCIGILLFQVMLRPYRSSSINIATTALYFSLTLQAILQLAAFSPIPQSSLEVGQVSIEIITLAPLVVLFLWMQVPHWIVKAKNLAAPKVASFKAMVTNRLTNFKSKRGELSVELDTTERSAGLTTATTEKVFVKSENNLNDEDRE